MKTLKNPILSALLAISMTCLVGCTAPSESSQEENLSLKSRAVNSEEAYPDIYHYKTIAAFVKGDRIGENQKQSFEGKQLSVCVMYDTDTPWAASFKTRSATVATGEEEPTGSHQFNRIISQYDLKINSQFQVDGYNECLILDFVGGIEHAAEACASISTIDHVLVVKVKEWPSLNSINSTTASTTKEAKRK